MIRRSIEIYQPASEHKVCDHVLLVLMDVPGCFEPETGNPFSKPIENDALNSRRPHRFGLV